MNKGQNATKPTKPGHWSRVGNKEANNYTSREAACISLVSRKHREYKSLGSFGENRRDATVGVLAGRNPALPGIPTQGHGCLSKISPTKKKARGTVIEVSSRKKDYFSTKDTFFYIDV